MPPTSPLEVLFLVDFRELAFRTIPFVAQLVDSVAAKLTLLHVCGEDERPAALERLHSFFPEADRYPACERLVIAGELRAVLERRLCATPPGLVIAPASESIELFRAGRRSLRMELLERCGAPLLTLGPKTRHARLGTPVRKVGCWVDLMDVKVGPQLAHAVEYAATVGASLHLMAALPTPRISLAQQEHVPLHSETASRQLIEAVARLGAEARAHIASEDDARHRRRLMESVDPDVLFVEHRHAPMFEWLGQRPRWFEEATCPLMAVPSEPRTSTWQLTAADDFVHGRKAPARPAVALTH